MAGQTFAPSGFTLTMDKTNHHLHKPVMIGEIQADGQFNVVWKTEPDPRPAVEPVHSGQRQEAGLRGEEQLSPGGRARAFGPTQIPVGAACSR
jgi:hypothetical protein